MNLTTNFNPLPTSSDHNCFACSQANAAGLKMTVKFRKTVSLGLMMEARSRVVVWDDREATMAGTLSDLDGNVCAVSEGTFRLFSPAVAKRLKIADENMLAWFHGLFESV